MERIHLSITERAHFFKSYLDGSYLSISAYSTKKAYVFQSVPIYLRCASETVSSEKREGSQGALDV